MSAVHLLVAPRAALPHPYKNMQSSFLAGKAPAPARLARGPAGSKSGGGWKIMALWSHAPYLATYRQPRPVTVRAGGGDAEEVQNTEAIEAASEEFKKLLDVSGEERDRVQEMQVIDRAEAAIAAARAVLSEQDSPPPSDNADSVSVGSETSASAAQAEGASGAGSRTPGPDFWSWTPPTDGERESDDTGTLQAEAAGSYSQDPIAASSVTEKDPSLSFLSIPFESKLILDSNRKSPAPPPLQSSVVDVGTTPSLVTPSLEEERGREVLLSAHAAEAALALDGDGDQSSSGVNPDGSRWWRESGVERRDDGVLCRWTLTRGVSASKVIEWEDKYWEAADHFDYKELGSVKSGRDAAGNVWREYWRESMKQEGEYVHFEKTADKWGKNGKGDEWQEKWWEHYDSSGRAEKWAHKWCRIDPSTHLEAGHAHVWHERWGEKYDGQGGSTKYTDKWAERFEGNGWTKWGDKWDENFDPNGHGVKQGETWWQGKLGGDQWNRTWGERHNGSGWVHKYGKSSSGEHWDTHVQQDTWYERFPHFGFWHCFENSIHLREVRRPET